MEEHRDAETVSKSQVSLSAPSALSVISSAGRKSKLSASISLPALPEASSEVAAQAARVQAALKRLNGGWTSTYGSMCADIYGPPKKPEEPQAPWQPKVMDSEYRDNFIDHQSPPPAVPVPKKQYVKTPAEAQREEAAQRKQLMMIQEARAKEKRRMDGRRSELHTGPLTAPMKPPISEVHYNYVGGPPTSLWRSDYRANLQPYVHTSTANKRMAQPNPLAVVSSPISLFPGVVGHPDM